MDRRKFLTAATAASVAAAASSVSLSGMDVPKRENKTSGKASAGIKVKFLGTGAADWGGRDERGELRRLSSVLVDECFLIDFTPSDMDMLGGEVRPKTIFYTHSHADHFNPAAAISIGVETVYLSQSWHSTAISRFREAAKELGKPAPEVIPLCIGGSATVAGIRVTALPANHGTSNFQEQTLIYLLEKEGVRVLYATDTGGIPAIASRLAGIDAHYPDGKPITGLIMEATMGPDHDVDFRIFTHSSVTTVEKTVKVLSSTGRYVPSEGQKVYLTHLARTLHPTQAQLDATLPEPLAAAYDGLEVLFSKAI